MISSSSLSVMVSKSANVSVCRGTDKKKKKWRERWFQAVWNCPWAAYRLAPITVIDTYLVPFRHEEVQPGPWEP